MLKKLYLGIGILFMILFLLSGLYLKEVVEGLPESHRLLLRTGHVYLFFASFLNILLGLYYPFTEKISWQSVFHHSLMWVSPPLLMYSFVFEAALVFNPHRSLGVLGVLLPFIWLGFMVLGRLWAAFRK